ncbi:translocation/assembly module TamB domain-containing protein [Chitinilyticum piscinae]|uniref:Translocation/assembly module TamB domain-containing protein n=1 Tax=Chitinilyticum piscinae TaxID=2866724 RepID=A0A8J7KEE1_9NEIS|nr:translocation/assembly module TamB domain-containing protein [Chitinilyticum piscinae]MBE9609414.1 translocation/assembly module TamB domain-containing protein [Chitinilyticum piscinae]
MAFQPGLGAGVVTAPETSPASPASKPASRRNWLRRIVWGMLTLLLLPAIVLAGLLTWLDTGTGREWLITQINASGVVRLAKLEGSLWSQWQAVGIEIRTPGDTFLLDSAKVQWSPYSLLLGQLDIDRLEAGVLIHKSHPVAQVSQPAPPPESLTLPLGIQIGQFSLLKWQEDEHLLFSRLAGRLGSNGRQHQLAIQQLQVPQGQLSGSAQLDGRLPFRLVSRFQFAGEIEQHPVSAKIKADGPLRQLAVAATVNGEKLAINTELSLDVFAAHAYQIVRSGKLQTRNVNPQALHASLPAALLDIDMELTPLGEQQATGKLSIINHQPAALDKKGIPLKALNTLLEYRHEKLYLKDFQANTQGVGRIHGQAELQKGRMDVHLVVEALNPAQLLSRQPSAALYGSITAAGAWLAPDLRIAIQDQQRKVQLATDLGWIQPERQRRIAVRKFQLTQQASSLDASGEIALDTSHDFRIEARFRQLDPSRWLSAPPADLNGSLTAKGHWAPALNLDLEYQLANSRFAGQNLTGEGRLQLDRDRINQVSAWLALGSNRIAASGRLGQAGDQLQLQLDLPALEQFGRGFSGTASGQVRLSGALVEPEISVQLAASRLAIPQIATVEELAIQGSLHANPDSPFNLTAKLRQLVAGSQRIRQAEASITGTRRQHHGRLAADAEQLGSPLSARLEFTGGLGSDWQWQGQVNSLEGQWRQGFKLAQAANLLLGAGQGEVTGARLSYGGSELRLEHLRWTERGWSSAGSIPRLVTAEWLELLPDLPVTGDLVAAANWQLNYDHTLNGEIHASRVQGDLQWRNPASTAKPQPFGLTQLRFNLASNASQLQLDGTLATNLGQAAIQGDARFDAAKLIDPLAPHAVRLQGTVPNLGAIAALTGTDMRLGGELQFDIRRSGTLDKPDYAGQITGKQLLVADPPLGLQLRDGQLDVSLSGRRLTLNRLSFRGGKGTLNASGVVAMDQSDQLAATAELQLDRFTLASKADLLLIASGKGQIRYTDGNIQIAGNFRADQGDIQYVDNDVPRLSDDVVIVGRKEPRKKADMKLGLLLDLDLGDDFRVRGYGLDAMLEGQLRLRASPGKPMTGSGTLAVKEGGIFRAYGQKLDIDRGILSFQGALDNPALDILAMRRNQQVEAGVKVVGTARTPRISLYSEPTVPDSEKLSWLMFGHGSSGMEKSDSALLLQMLNSMAGSGGGKGLTDDILDQVGIDEVGYRSERNDDGTTTQIVSVSKQMTRNLRVSLEKSLDGLSDAVKFSLNLTRGWSLITRIGTDKSSVDAYYSFTFD